MRDENFLNIQCALRTATEAPEAAPSGVIAHTVRRCEAVLAGREAERRLKQETELPPEKVYDLAAAGVLGQLALGRRLPEGRDISEMQRQLSASGWFRQQLSGTAENALNCLRSGTLLLGGTEHVNNSLGQTKRLEEHKQPPKAKGGVCG